MDMKVRGRLSVHRQSTARGVAAVASPYNHLLISEYGSLEV
jgi:hypothetical protein